MQKRAVLSGRLSFVHTVYPILKVHSTDFFSNIFFFQRPLTRGDEEVPWMALRVLRPKSPHSEEWTQYIEQNLSCVRFAFFIMYRLPKHSCAVTAQHLPCRCFSLSIIPELYSGAFSRKSTFLKIFLLIYLSYTLPSSAERRAGEDRENNGTTPRQQKVLFVGLCNILGT